MKFKNTIYIFITIVIIICSIKVINFLKNKANKKDLIMIKTGEKIAKANFNKLENPINSKNSTILFKILKNGNSIKPISGQTVTVHYTGWLLQDDLIGEKFDSSKTRNQTFKFKIGSNMVISGWEEILQHMSVGEIILVILPPSSAYGARGAGKIIPPNSTLLFEIELLKIN